MTKTYLEPEDVTRLQEVAVYSRDKLLIRVLFHLGCRISEALALKVDDVDFDRSTIIIKHLKRRLKLSCSSCGARLGIAHVYCPACGHKVEGVLTEQQEHRRQRVLPVDGETLNMLRQYISRGGPILRDGKRLIFGINRHRAWQIIRDCARKAGLPKLVNPETGKVHNVSPHRLRDAFSVMAVQRDDSTDSVRMLQQHLGHQSISTTMRYRKVSGKEHKDWYQKLWEEQSDG